MENYRYFIRIPNHLGDTIMAQPAVEAFLQLNENEKTVLMMPDWAKPIYKKEGNVKIIALPSNRRHGFSAVLFQVRELRKYKIETGILLTPSFSSALALFAGGIKNRYGYAGDGRRMLLNNCVTLAKEDRLHRSEKYKLLLENAGKKRLEIPPPRILISDSQKYSVADLLEQNGITRTDRYLVIGPQAVAESRRWGTENYAALAGLLIKNLDIKIVLIGTANQYNSGQKIAFDPENIKNLCGKTDIEQAALILAGAVLFIGNDSGLAHLASSVDIPLLILSGADNPKETSPISDKKTVIIKSYLDCISCVKNICPKSGIEYMSCMKEISVKEIFEIISQNILSRFQP